MKKLGFYCSSDSWGGLEMNISRLANWVKLDHQNVVLFCVQGSKMDAFAKEHHIETIYIQKNKKYFDFFNAKRVAKLVDKHKVDVLWIRHTRDIDIIGFVKKFAKRTLKLVYHQAMELGVNKKGYFHTRRFKQLDAWVTLLPYLKKQVLEKTKLDASKIKLMPLAMDLSRFVNCKTTAEEAKAYFGFNKEEKVIGVIGRFDPKKCQDIVIKAMSQLNTKNIKLLIVGEGTHNEGDTYETELHQLVADYGLENTVIFKPFMKDVEVFFKAIDAFVIPSLSETFGMVTIEAMASGVPIIGTNSGGTPEILDHGKLGELFNPNDVHLLGIKIDEVFDNYTSATEKAEKAKQKAMKEYSHIEYVKNIKALVDRL